MRVFALLFIAFLAFLPQSIIAQTNAATATPATTNNDPIAEYAAYNHAIAAGDIDTAARHAMAAWRGAEDAWGAGNVNTGALAYNAAWSALLNGAISSSIEPARRAIELARPSGGAYTPEEAKFLLAFGEFSLATPAQRNRQVRAFIGAIEKVENSWEDQLIVDALSLAASTEIGPNNAWKARALANRALAQAERLELATSPSRAHALIVRGIAQLWTQKYPEAVSDMIDARLAYGSPRNHDDKIWGQLASWELTAGAIANSHGYHRQASLSSNGNSDPLRDREFRGMSSAERNLTRYQPHCGTWQATRIENIGAEIVFPHTARTEMMSNGAVVARISLNPVGTVKDVFILGVVPEEIYAANAKQAIMTWHFDISGSPSTDCLSDYLMMVTFRLQ